MPGFWREYVVKRFERSSQWMSVRSAFIEKHSCCAVCGKRKKLQVHHKVPFSVRPDLELVESNLVTLCDRCHLFIGHIGYFVSWNPSIDSDISIWKHKFQHRPNKDKDSEEKVNLWKRYIAYQNDQIKKAKDFLGLDLDLK